MKRYQHCCYDLNVEGTNGHADTKVLSQIHTSNITQTEQVIFTYSGLYIYQQLKKKATNLRENSVTHGRDGGE